MGLRAVTLVTEPLGADVSFVPLNKVTGEPMPEQIIHASDGSSAHANLRPGDYLVVAVLDDGRFHEVLRHVPELDETLPGYFRHNRWKVEKEDVIVLPEVKIPDSTVSDDMAYVHGATFFRAAGQSASVSGPSLQTVPSFYVDTAEFSVADYELISGDGKPADIRSQPKNSNAAVNVSFDEAVALAESIGKRLLTETEFEFAATAGGTSTFPWGDTPPEEIHLTKSIGFDSVGTPDFDALETSPTVMGLCSNVAEWTSTIPHPISTDSTSLRLDSNLASDYRVVKGGDYQTIDGLAEVSGRIETPDEVLGSHDIT